MASSLPSNTSNYTAILIPTFIPKRTSQSQQTFSIRFANLRSKFSSQRYDLPSPNPNLHSLVTLITAHLLYRNELHGLSKPYYDFTDWSSSYPDGSPGHGRLKRSDGEPGWYLAEQMEIKLLQIGSVRVAILKACDLLKGLSRGGSV